MAEHLINIEQAQADLLSCAAFLAEDIKSADGHAEAMKRIVPLYAEKGEVDLAAEFANTVDDPFTRDRLLSLIAARCAALDDDEYALQLVEAIEDDGMQAQTLEKIALQKTTKGEFAKAFEIAETMDHPDYAFADIAVYQAAAGDDDNAAQTIGRIEYENAGASALQSIATAKLEKSETEKAVALLEQAASIAADIEHREEKIRSLTDIGNLFVEAKRNDRAIETLDRAKANAEKLDNVHRDNLLGSVAHGFMRAGSIDLADRALDLVTDKTQIASCLVLFAREYQARNETTDALETLEEAYAVLKSQKDTETRDSRAKFKLFSTIAVEFARQGKPERAVEIALNNQDENESHTALAQIAQLLAAGKSDESARSAIQAINEDSARMFALISVSDALEAAGEREKAVEYLTEAAHLAETVPQLASRSTAYNELAARFARYEATEKARAASRENLEIIAQIRDESSRAVALAQLSQIYEANNFELTDAEKQIIFTLIRRAEW